MPDAPYLFIVGSGVVGTSRIYEAATSNLLTLAARAVSYTIASRSQALTVTDRQTALTVEDR